MNINDSLVNMDEIEQKKEKIMLSALEIISEEGCCSSDLLEKASEKSGYESGMGELLFPDGKIVALMRYIMDKLDQKMLDHYKKKSKTNWGITKSIEEAISIKLDLLEENREEMIQCFLFLSKPQNMLQHNKSLWKSVDLIWREIGKDKSTNYNYYSKRILLFGVYLHVILTWRKKGLKQSKIELQQKLKQVSEWGKKIGSLIHGKKTQ